MAKIIEGVNGVKNQYRIDKVVNRYEKDRFSSFIGKLTNIMEIDIIKNILKEKQPSKLVEIGVGTGRISKDLDYFDEAIGADTSIEMLKIAKKNIKTHSWTLCEADIMDLPLKDETVDAVIVFHLIRHFDEQRRRKAYQELHRVLGKNGFLVMEVLNKDVGLITTIIKRFSRRVARLIRGEEYYEVYDELYKIEEFEKELSESGFELEGKSGIICHYNLYFPFHILTKLKFLQKIMETIILPIAIHIERTHEKKAKHCISWVILGTKK